jgi:hypothetical protein
MPGQFGAALPFGVADPFCRVPFFVFLVLYLALGNLYVFLFVISYRLHL